MFHCMPTPAVQWNTIECFHTIILNGVWFIRDTDVYEVGHMVMIGFMILQPHSSSMYRCRSTHPIIITAILMFSASSLLIG